MFLLHFIPGGCMLPGVMDIFFCIIKAQYSFLRVPRGPMVRQCHQVLTRLASSSFLCLVWLRALSVLLLIPKMLFSLQLRTIAIRGELVLRVHNITDDSWHMALLVRS